MENGYYEIYLDGRLVSSGVDLNANGEIQGNGLLIIGQEQVSNDVNHVFELKIQLIPEKGRSRNKFQ